jgi:hypothetical protein
MTSPLAGSLAKTIGGAMAGLFLPATLARTTYAAAENPWDQGTPTTTEYTCRAIHEEWGATWLRDGLVAADEVKVLILASTLTTEPEPGDVITVRGIGFTIVPAGTGKAAVSTDPAKAVWECRARK